MNFYQGVVLENDAENEDGFPIPNPYRHPYEFSTLLPPNATQFERDLEAAIREEFNFPIEADGHRAIGIYRAMDPEECPVELLPYLAANRSIELDTTLPEPAQRELIRKSFEIHSNEGTVQSVLDVITALGYLGASIEEGEPKHDHWAKFSIVLNASSEYATSDAITHDEGQQLIRYINDFVPLSRHLVSVDFTMGEYLWDGTISFDGVYTFGAVVAVPS